MCTRGKSSHLQTSFLSCCTACGSLQTGELSVCTLYLLTVEAAQPKQCCRVGGIDCAAPPQIHTYSLCGHHHGPAQPVAHSAHLVRVPDAEPALQLQGTCPRAAVPATSHDHIHSAILLLHDGYMQNASASGLHGWPCLCSTISGQITLAL